MAKFKVGDKVRVKSDLNGCVGVSWTMLNNRGNVMTISLCDATEHMQYKVEEDCLNLWWDESVFEPVAKREFIVIRRDGNVMTAEHRVNREVIKSAKATCAPSDTFDFDTGAKLAFDRLIGRQNIEEAVKARNEPAPQPAHRFKVGDRVVYEARVVGVVKEINVTVMPQIPYWVEFEDGSMWLGDDSLSPAPEPPKFYTGKVVCVEWKGDVFRYTNAGRIAMITNGISDYAGWNRMSKRFESFSDFCSANTFGVFYEIKE